MDEVKISYDEAIKQGLTKECKDCHRVKSVTEFYKHKKGKYGAESKCKTCRAKYHQEHRNDAMSKVKISYDEAVKLGLTKECTECHKVKSVSEFRRKKDGKYGAGSECRECRGNHKREYRQTPQGKESRRKDNQKRKALKNQSFYHPFSKEDKEFCLNYFNFTCPYSGKPLTDSDIHLDHIVPLSNKDGVPATAPWNLITCNASINISKSNKPILEFISTLPNPDEVYNRIREYIILQAKKYINIIPKDDITLKVFNITFDELKEAV